MRIRLLLILLGFCFISNAAANDKYDSYTLYLIRHAEKQQNGSRDPVLTEAGKKRSNQLAHWFQSKDIKDIWSSDYKRTRDTAKPLLAELGLESSIYDPGNQAVLVEQLLHKQHNALIIGHSNTIPELARLLCGCFIEDMQETEHDRLIVVSIVGTNTQIKTLQQKPLSQP
jgi:broad specificity phosphatase PhoE